MSSTERAPEPTMEEILASIRRIISEDEPSSARQPNASASQQDDEGLEIAEGEADDKIINDIARVLSGAAPAVEEEEDILDLTAELGGLEPVEELEAVELVAEAPAPVRQPAATVEANLAPASQASAPQAEPAEKAPEAKVEAPPQPMSASEEAASALERAIAALRAGHVPTSSPQSESQFMPTFAFAPEPEPEPEPQPGPEPELVLTEFEVEAVAEEPVFLEALVSEPEPEEIQAWESEAPSLDVREEPENEPEPQAPPTNGSGAHPAYDAAAPSAGAMPLGASPKTLEDSIKDMLRPMLRQWLEENMSRVLTAALKDELKDELGHSAGQGQDD
jgi:cell pole-organizing protein PopZ